MEQIVEVEQQDLLAGPLDPLAPFREQVRAELAEKSVRQKMSPEALAKFRAQRRRPNSKRWTRTVYQLAEVRHRDY